MASFQYNVVSAARVMMIVVYLGCGGGEEEDAGSSWGGVATLCVQGISPSSIYTN